ncbi:hypothetical protein ACP6H1_27395 [Vibrio harveyi]|uniref:hypothetical protein n=1 Tax=Vibrio harveyi TaxID=669 RepID=UPI003CF9ADA5
MRIGKKQKTALLFIHMVELKAGKHTPVHTSFLRKSTEKYLGVEIKSNNFLVSMRTLADNGYVVFQPNTEKLLNSKARDNENMWQLTDEGRRYIEEVHCKSLTPKRAYTKKL